MSRNNQDRVGARSSDTLPPIPQLTQDPPQPPLHFVVPTEFVSLPSRGRLHPEDHYLRGKEEIEIRHMTAKEEDILTDKTLLKKGIAIDRLLKNIIVDRSIQVDDLLIGDKNAILIAARISGYGPEYDTKLICPVCFSHGRHEFDLREAKVYSADNIEEHGARRTGTGTILLTTPRLGVEVECRVLSGDDEKKILNQQKNNKKLKLPESNLTSQLRTILVSVNGNTDRSYINSFVDSVPAIDSRYIRSTYNKCIPNVELKEDYVCGECGASTVVDVPFTTDFFWPDI